MKTAKNDPSIERSFFSCFLLSKKYFLSGMECLFLNENIVRQIRISGEFLLQKERKKARERRGNKIKENLNNKVQTFIDKQRGRERERGKRGKRRQNRT